MVLMSGWMVVLHTISSLHICPSFVQKLDTSGLIINNGNGSTSKKLDSGCNQNLICNTARVLLSLASEMLDFSFENVEFISNRWSSEYKLSQSLSLLKRVTWLLNYLLVIFTSCSLPPTNTTVEGAGVH